MTSSRLRNLVVVYCVLLVLCGIGYAKYSSYQVDGDAVSFMDISDAIRAHNLPLVVNGYWNPAYAAALAAGVAIGHPSRMNELQTFFWVNFWIYVACIFGCIFFVRGLVLVRERKLADSGSLPALSSNLLLLASMALMFYSFQREINLGAVRSDGLLFFLLLMAASFLLRLQSTGRFIYYPLLGLALGLAYLTKSFAFLPSGILLASLFVFGLTRKVPQRNRIVGGTLLAGVIFAAVAGPYIVAISKQRGRPTTGESARLNYAFFVDQTERWHEWHSGKMGHATANFKHHEELLLDSPPVYSYAAHPLGTFPLWFDPSYWTDTIQPKFYLKGHLLRLERCTALLVRYVLGHLEPWVLLAVLLFGGCFFARRRGEWLPLAPAAIWGLLMFGIYFPIDFQDRYLTAPYLLVLLPVLAMLRRPATGHGAEVATGVVLLLAFLSLADGVSDVALRRRTLSTAGYPRGAYDPQIYPAAQGLAELGIKPGAAVACFGDRACDVDHYWARLAETPIRAEIEVPDGSDPGAFWQAQTDKPEIVEALRTHHIAAIVSSFSATDHSPQGWRQLGRSNFYAYPITAEQK